MKKQRVIFVILLVSAALAVWASEAYGQEIHQVYLPTISTSDELTISPLVDEGEADEDGVTAANGTPPVFEGWTFTKENHPAAAADWYFQSSVVKKGVPIVATYDVNSLDGSTVKFCDHDYDPKRPNEFDRLFEINGQSIEIYAQDPSNDGWLACKIFRNVDTIRYANGSDSGGSNFAIVLTGQVSVNKLDQNDAEWTGVTVNLKDADGNIIATDETPASFDGLDYGSYTIEEVVPVGSEPIGPTSYDFVVSAETLSFNFTFKNERLTGQVSVNKLDQNDAEWTGVTVNLKDADGNIIATDETPASFDGLDYGSYTIEEVVPVGSEPIGPTSYDFVVSAETLSFNFTFKNERGPSVLYIPIVFNQRTPLCTMLTASVPNGAPIAADTEITFEVHTRNVKSVKLGETTATPNSNGIATITLQAQPGQNYEPEILSLEDTWIPAGESCRASYVPFPTDVLRVVTIWDDPKYYVTLSGAETAVAYNWTTGEFKSNVSHEDKRTYDLDLLGEPTDGELHAFAVGWKNPEERMTLRFQKLFSGDDASHTFHNELGWWFNGQSVTVKELGSYQYGVPNENPLSYNVAGNGHVWTDQTVGSRVDLDNVAVAVPGKFWDERNNGSQAVGVLHGCLGVVSVREHVPSGSAPTSALFQIVVYEGCEEYIAQLEDGYLLPVLQGEKRVADPNEFRVTDLLPVADAASLERDDVQIELVPLDSNAAAADLQNVSLFLPTINR